MPVRRFTPTLTALEAQLVDRLTREWKLPDPTVTEPVILEEQDKKGELVHVYVVWSDWAHLDREKRGDIIMDAAEQVKTQGQILNITIAMGLTPDEADRFNLKWR